MTSIALWMTFAVQVAGAGDGAPATAAPAEAPQIRGRLRGEGAAVGGVVIRGIPVDAARPLPTIEARTAADGTFVLDGAVAASYRLSVRVPGYALLEKVVRAPNAGVDLLLRTTGGISGLVVDDGDRPVESFTIAAESERGQHGRAVKSEAGRFTLEDLQPGSYTVDVFSKGRGRLTIADVKVDRASVTDLGRIQLAAGGSVRGFVLDARSSPVPGATVEARSLDHRVFRSDETHETVTDAGGGFELHGVRPGNVALVVRHPDYSPGRSAPVKVELDRTAEARVVLRRGGRIEGVVRRRGAIGLPEMSIDLEALSADTHLEMRERIAVGADGTFRIDHVPPGRVAVMVVAWRGLEAPPSRQLSQEIEVREAETTRVEFVWRQIRLTGRVTRGGAPLPGLRLVARSASSDQVRADDRPERSTGPAFMAAVTRQDGTYEMLVREAGRIAISVEARGGRAYFPTRTVDLADVDSQVADLSYPAGGISGIVVDGQTGAPIAGASVNAMNRETGGGGNATTGADGRFVIDVDPGDFYAQANVEGYTPGGVPVTVGEAPAADIRIDLVRGASIRGTVVDGQGRPAAGIALTARNAADGFGDSASTGPDGSFAFTSLKAGTYDLTGGSTLLGFRRLAGVPTGRADVLVRLIPSGRLRVRATAADGTPIAGATVVVRSLDGAPFWTDTGGGPTDPDGTAEIAAPAGLVGIESRKGRSTGRGEVAVASGGRSAVDITLSEEAPPPAP